MSVVVPFSELCDTNPTGEIKEVPNSPKDFQICLRVKLWAIRNGYENPLYAQIAFDVVKQTLQLMGQEKFDCDDRYPHLDSYASRKMIPEVWTHTGIDRQALVEFLAARGDFLVLNLRKEG